MERKINVLEKILEEILQYRKDNNLNAGKQVIEIERIIRFHMNEVPSINVEDWVAVSERRPEKTGYYLVTLKRKLPNEDYSDRVVSLYDKEEEEFLSYDNLIIAWKPLPEPYR